jgi:predicted transposase YbfD/YdcC
MVSAWAHEEGLVLGQKSVTEKSNEITAIPDLLEMLELKGNVVTIDAMGCQKEIAKQIIEKKGDYIFSLKAIKEVWKKMFNAYLLEQRKLGL